jgi:excinuclease ABC subunit B
MTAGYQLQSPYAPAGDQPQAIEALARGLLAGQRFQTLEGVTGSGKTFTMAHLIARTRRPALVISHNKTLAAQLYAEFKEYFPRDSVEYFVSYYDYYQPEAYIPQTDTFIEKDASINKEIERLRLSATNALLSRSQVIIVASVSCIYGLGSPADYREMGVELKVGGRANRDTVLARLVEIQYTRNEYTGEPGTFRVRGDIVEIYPSYSTQGYRVGFCGDEIESLRVIDPVTRNILDRLETLLISPATHFVMPRDKIAACVPGIVAEMEAQIRHFEQRNLWIEAQRIKMRTLYDVEMLQELGYCQGIENYSRHLSGRAPGEPPATLIDYFSDEFLTLIDESHVTLPQIRGMFNGDQARKRVLVEHGFRLPSALDNRPLGFDEFLGRVGPMIFVSATPGPYERQMAPEAVRQVIRPTGLVDPEVEVRPLTGQIDDVIHEITECAARGQRVLVTTLTKKTAEDLAEYLRTAGLRARYLHSDIDAIERVEILRSLRKADFDCLIGINLLREGLDLPEVARVLILDADKEGFLRSETALIQTAGRAARHIEGRVVLYADQVTDSMRRMMAVTTERRECQLAYNREHQITPRSIVKAIQHSLVIRDEAHTVESSIVRESGREEEVFDVIQDLEQEMLAAAEALEFERAAVLRDQIRKLKGEVSDKTGTVPVLKAKKPAASQAGKSFRYPTAGGRKK